MISATNGNPFSHGATDFSEEKFDGDSAANKKDVLQNAQSKAINGCKGDKGNTLWTRVMNPWMTAVVVVVVAGIALSYCAGTEVPELMNAEELSNWIENNQNVEHLDLSRTGITELPETIGSLTKLTSLNLSRTGITELPETIGSLTKLTSLNLSRTGITEFSEIIGKLTKLTSLDLSGTGITELPETIGSLTNLISLDLSVTGIKELPETIGNLINLTSLDLSWSGITKLPETIGGLINLTSLDLSGAEITKLPETIEGLINLTSLDLSGAGITKLPETIGGLINLTSLDLSGAGIKELPETIGNLINLISLNLSRTGITELPETIGGLINLTSLNLHGTGVMKLPETIGGLTNLIKLDLSETRITELPETIGKLTNLTILKLAKTPLESAPFFEDKLKPEQAAFITEHQSEIEEMYNSKVPTGNWMLLGKGASKAVYVHPDLPGSLVKIPIRKIALRSGVDNDIITHYNGLQHVRKLTETFRFNSIVLPKSVLLKSQSGPYVVEEKFDLVPVSSALLGNVKEKVKAEFQRLLEVSHLCDVNIFKNAGFLRGTENDPKIGIFDFDCRR